MSGRTCQFCGKPLWRLRLGGDGDFCSREHRNQYQLRKGLTHLAEGDRLAGIRRRREQVVVAALLRPAGPALLEARRSFVFKSIGPRGPAVALLPHVALAGAGKFLTERTARLPQNGSAGIRVARNGAAARTATPGFAVAVPGVHVPPRQEPRRVGGRAGVVPREPQARPRRLASAPRVQRLRGWAHRQPVGLRALELQLPPSGAVFDERPPAEVAPPLPLPVPAAQRGPSLRLACALAPVTLQEPLVPATHLLSETVEMPLARYALMPYEVAAAPVEPRSFESEWAPAAFQFLTLEDRWLVVLGACRLAVPAPRPLACPPLPGVVRRMPARLRSPLPRTLFASLRASFARGHGKLRAPRFLPGRLTWHPGARLGRLTAGLDRTMPTPACSLRPESHTRPSLAEANAVRRVAVACRPGRPLSLPPCSLASPPLAPAAIRAYLRAGRRPAMAAQTILPGSDGRDVALRSIPAPAAQARSAECGFVTRDLFFTAPQMPIRGDIESLLKASAAAPQLFEDHFSSGLGKWSEGAADWKVDLAGVRVGSAAFYQPTAGLRDYDVEFLARVEAGGLTCLLRASGPGQAYAVRVLTGCGGALQLQRTTWIDGAAQGDPVTVDVTSDRTKSALNIRIKVEGSKFAVCIDGREIHQWSDARLATGAIGFQTNPGDRARIYWVRISAAPAPTGSEKR